MTLNYESFLFLPLVLSVNSLEQKCFLSNRETFYHKNPGYVEKEKQTTIEKRGTSDSRYVFFVLHIRVPLCFPFFISIFIVDEFGKEEQTHYKSQKRGINSFGSQLAPTSKKTKEFLIC